MVDETALNCCIGLRFAVPVCRLNVRGFYFFLFFFFLNAMVNNLIATSQSWSIIPDDAYFRLSPLEATGHFLIQHSLKP